ncbi:MAG: hypothetical protein AAF337_13445 [Pseudomonadota bacterium]
MARKPEEEANHWPGFVDALSTIVMVITFLLILLGLTLFIMMQKIQSDANTAADTQVSSDAINGAQLVNEEQRQSENEEASSSASKTSQVAELQDKLQEAQKEIEKLKTQTQQMAGAPEAPEGQSVASMGAELRQEEQIETEDKLTILTRKTDDKVKVAIASQEPVTTDGKIKVTSAAIALELNYDANTTKLDEEAATQVGDYFSEKAPQSQDAIFEIRSIASSGVGSFSEARRKAYFRALTVRNILLKRGVAAERIATRISMPQPGEKQDRVIVTLKPR